MVKKEELANSVWNKSQERVNEENTQASLNTELPNQIQDVVFDKGTSLKQCFHTRLCF